MKRLEEHLKSIEVEEIHTPVTPLELTKLLIFLNSMRDDNRHILIKRLQIDDKDNSLSKFIENAWDRRLNFQFESSFLPVYVLCRDEYTNTLNRRGGAVLEVTSNNRKTDKFEMKRWVAVFRYESRAGYFLEYLKELKAIPLESNNKTVQRDIIINSIYICPIKKELTTNESLEALKQKREVLISDEVERKWEENEY